ncbi:hypothetical protein BT96DRAFT_1008219 [Gymnopus androsaceus JB14]|uniref:Uncharacterized protein n=1 Tax=Gymnopus androsaceus JB14 TaxID=1447944 RepID=A0A6A4GFE3_9AGAR|nr:hypothetical protein BT96DRAFT_1008219 [Gymnopus androsaceus JB14]
MHAGIDLVIQPLPIGLEQHIRILYFKLRVFRPKVLFTLFLLRSKLGSTTFAAAGLITIDVSSVLRTSREGSHSAHRARSLSPPAAGRFVNSCPSHRSRRSSPGPHHDQAYIRAPLTWRQPLRSLRRKGRRKKKSSWLSRLISQQWTPNLIVFMIGMISIVGGYKSNTVLVTVFSALAAFCSFMLFVLDWLRDNSKNLRLPTFINRSKWKAEEFQSDWSRFVDVHVEDIENRCTPVREAGTEPFLEDNSHELRQYIDYFDFAAAESPKYQGTFI